MIKVIASDMDGTLLGDDHKIAPETQVAIKRACDAGIRFMVATGRNFRGAMDALKDTDITCDYILSSGAEVRNPQREVVKRTPIPIDLCEEVYEELKEYPVSVIFFTDRYDYRLGTKKEIEEGIIRQIRLFHMDKNDSDEKIRNSAQFLQIAGNTEESQISVLWKNVRRLCTRSLFLQEMWTCFRRSGRSLDRILSLRWHLPLS